LRGGRRKVRAYWSGGYCPASAGNPSWRAILEGEGIRDKKRVEKEEKSGIFKNKKRRGFTKAIGARKTGPPNYC
jgi:hypothetical protein